MPTQRAGLWNRIYFLDRWTRFWASCRWWIILCCMAFLCDAASTMYFMLRDQTADGELHPVIRLASAVVGPVAGPILSAIGKLAAVILVCLLLPRAAKYLLFAASALSFWAAWYNIWGCELYIPRLIKWITW